jgi:hypothetical protein
MPKRKAASHNKQDDADGAKKPRSEGAAAAAGDVADNQSSLKAARDPIWHRASPCRHLS